MLTSSVSGHQACGRVLTLVGVVKVVVVVALPEHLGDRVNVVDLGRRVAIVLHDARAVDEHVNNVRLRRDVVVQLLAARLGRHVALNAAAVSTCPYVAARSRHSRNNAAALSGLRGDLGRRLVEHLLPATRDEDLGAVGSVRRRDGCKLVTNKYCWGQIRPGKPSRHRVVGCPEMLFWSDYPQSMATRPHRAHSQLFPATTRHTTHPFRDQCRRR